MLSLSLPKTDISAIVLIASLHWFQFQPIFFNTVDWNCINISHEILPVPCLEDSVFPPPLKISPNLSEHYIICFHSCVILAGLAHWQSIRTLRSFSFSVASSWWFQEHDFAVHIIKFLSLQATRSSNSSMIIWSSSVLAMLSSFVPHANFLRLGLIIIPNSWQYTLNGIAPKTNPWGIPMGNLLSSYKSFLIVTCCSFFTLLLY